MCVLFVKLPVIAWTSSFGRAGFAGCWKLNYISDHLHEHQHESCCHQIHRHSSCLHLSSLPVIKWQPNPHMSASKMSMLFLVTVQQVTVWCKILYEHWYYLLMSFQWQVMWWGDRFLASVTFLSSRWFWSWIFCYCLWNTDVSFHHRILYWHHHIFVLSTTKHLSIRTHNLKFMFDNLSMWLLHTISFHIELVI